MYVQWYYSFLAVAKYGSYRKASQKLFLSESAIFKHIENLEKFLHLQLMTRNRKIVQLTTAGEELLLVATKFVLFFENEILPFKNDYNVKSIIKIGASPYVANFIMTNFLFFLHQVRPDIQVSLDTISKGSLKKALENKEVDILVSRIELTSSTIYCHKIYEGRLALLVPETKENENIDDEKYYLSNYAVYYHTHPYHSTAIKKELHKLFPETNLEDITNVLVSKGLIQSGGGISYLPIHILGETDKGIKIVKSKLFPKMDSYLYFSTLEESKDEKVDFIQEFFTYYMNQLKKL